MINTLVLTKDGRQLLEVGGGLDGEVQHRRAEPDGLGSRLLEGGGGQEVT